MKIIDIISEDFHVGGGDSGVGNAGGDSIIMKAPTPMRRLKKPPQVGYGIKIGKMTIPTPEYTSDNDREQINKVEGG